MDTAEQEVFRELRRERLWQFAERMAPRVVYAMVGILLIGLVSAATVVWMDDSDGLFASAVSDDE